MQAVAGFLRDTKLASNLRGIRVSGLEDHAPADPRGREGESQPAVAPAESLVAAPVAGRFELLAVALDDLLRDVARHVVVVVQGHRE